MTQGALPLSHAVVVGAHALPLDIARHPRARRYVLRLTPAGRLRLTVPRGASIAGGLRFAERQRDWIAREWRRLEAQAADWADGTEIWYRGARVPLSVTPDVAEIGGDRIPLSSPDSVRRAVEAHLRLLATRELPARTNVLAVDRGLTSVRVQVRNQRSRWGSCSPRGSIALNWRLIQMPPDVADYIVLHELAHRRHPNHSRRFWREVAALCSWWRDAERWLRKHGRELL